MQVKKPQRDQYGRFVRGNAGGGRKKLPSEFYRVISARSIDALRTIVNIMDDKSAPTALRLKAALWIVDRTYGKALDAVQQQEIEKENDPFYDL